MTETSREGILKRLLAVAVCEARRAGCEWLHSVRFRLSPAQPVGELLSIQTDCRDPERLAAFWGAVLCLDFDLIIDDLDAATRRVESLGGKPVPKGDRHEYGYTWRIMADPEGNEFCLIEKSETGEMDTNRA